MKKISWIFRYAAICTILALSGCSGGGSNGDENNGGASIAASQAAYIVVAWNDLGMHCLNPSYDNAVILPPYNTVWAQVIKRGNPPQIMTTGITVEYSIDGNTSSYGKRKYGQFWDNMLHLFGVSLPRDKGLNLDNPAINNGLSGTMVMKADHFQVNGIPVTPVNDSGTWNPFQVAIVTVKDQTGAVIAATRATVPTSDEINCAKCHGNATTDPLLDVLQKHDLLSGTTLTANKPVLCAATCHGSPALGLPPGPNKYLSQAIHSFHATKNALCYDCHPGATTSCNRSARHTAPDGNCITCHGDLNTVGSSIAAGRVPWGSEPKCVTCHIGVAGVDTGAVLYRNDPGHGGIYCAGCHGSPHAMLPSNLASDNYQAIQYQGVAKTLGDCGVCHATSRGGGNDFAGEHVAEGRMSACNVCHTGFINAANITNWPHQFQWKAR